MLSQLAPSGNMVFSPSRSHQSPKQSHLNLPILSQSQSTHSSVSANSAAPSPQQQQQQQGHSGLAFSLNNNDLSTATSTQPNPMLSTSASNISPQFALNASPQQTHGNCTPLALLPPLPLPQFNDSALFNSTTNNLTPLNTTASNLSFQTDNQQLPPSQDESFNPTFSPRRYSQTPLQHPINTSTSPSPLSSPNSINEEYPDDQIVERALLEDSFIEHGLLAVDKNVSILGEILNLSEGRDKLFKLFAAVLKLVRYGLMSWLPQSDLTTDILGRIKACSAATSTTRLFLKLCTDWVFFRLAARVYSQQRSGMLKFFTLSRLLGMAGYFTFQWPVWFQSTGLAKSIDKSFWQKLSLRCYIVSVCSQIFMDMRKAIDLTKEIGYWQLIVPGEALKELERTSSQPEAVHLTSASTTPPLANNNSSLPSSSFSLNSPGQSPVKGGSPASSTLAGKLSPSLVAKSPTTNPNSSPAIATSQSPLMNNNNNNNLSGATSFSKLPSLAQDPEVNPTYALSFQSRCTPTTARYQALLNRTIWQQQLQAQIAAAQQLSSTPQSPVPQSPGMFQSLLSLPTTLNNRFRDQLQLKSHQQSDMLPTHPYIIARDQHDVFNAQLKQLQEETRMALVRENILQKDRNKLFVNFIKDGGDLFGSLDGLYDWGHSDLTLGLISLVSAGISIYRMWAKYKQTIEKAILEEAREVIRKQQEDDEEQRRGEEDRARLGLWADQVRDYYESIQQQQFQAQQQQLQHHQEQQEQLQQQLQEQQEQLQQQLQDQQEQLQQQQQLQDQLNIHQSNSAANLMTVLTGQQPSHQSQPNSVVVDDLIVINDDVKSPPPQQPGAKVTSTTPFDDNISTYTPKKHQFDKGA